MSTSALLSIRDLNIRYRVRGSEVDAVRGASFDVMPGEVTALVGESGSGKSSIAQAAIGLLAGNGHVQGGSMTLGAARSHGAVNLTELSERGWRRIRGRCIGLIPQDPGNSLNPVATIGQNIAEGMRIHRLATGAALRRKVLDLLERVGIDDPELRARQYPHELSGGMRQRVLIAAAIALEPEVIIADEPTSALDVTVQRTVLDLLDDLRRDSGTGILFITHDLAVAADRSDQLVVLRQGQVQESGATGDLLAAPATDYTRRLLADAPSLADVVHREVAPVTGDPIVTVTDLRQEFARASGEPLVAVKDVSFTVARGTTHALVGESGSGKTTTGRAIAGFSRPTAGSVQVAGVAVDGLRSAREYRRTTQLVAQNPYASLDPRQSIGDIIAEPLKNFRLASAAQRRVWVAEYLERVSLAPEIAMRKPRELSGGQRQRVAIARALILEPEVVVLDEAVSALDVTVQAQILRLLAELQQELGLTYIFISHDLAVVRQIADTVSVMKRGVQVEHGTVADVFASPRHEYTRQLLDAIPGTDFRAHRYDPQEAAS